jgi:potassium channel subfamily K
LLSKFSNKSGPDLELGGGIHISNESRSERPKLKDKAVSRQPCKGGTSHVSASQRHASSDKDASEKEKAAASDRPDELPTGDDMYLLLISQIQIVAGHVREPETKRYTFEEWAWYLRLIGEDERDPDTHSPTKPDDLTKPLRRVSSTTSGIGFYRQEEEGSQSMVDAYERLKWSWLGNESPLLGPQEESEWILEKLMDRLRALLLMARRRHDSAKG